MDTPLLTVYCATFNHGKYIGDALEGFVRQKTNFKYEIIVHDDASTDNTADIVREYEKKYPAKIKAIYQTENQYSQGKRIGADIVFPMVKTKYFAQCEGDDYWTDDHKLQKQFDFLEANPDFGLVFTEVDILDQEDGIWHHNAFHTGHMPLYTTFDDVLIHKGFCAPCTWMLRTELLPTQDGPRFADGSFVWLLSMFAKSEVKYMPESMAVYRVLKKSASHHTDFNKKYSYINGVYKSQLFFADHYNRSEEVKREIELHHFLDFYPIMVVVKDKENVKKGRKILKSVKDKPLKIRLALLLSHGNIGAFILKNILKMRS